MSTFQQCEWCKTPKVGIYTSAKVASSPLEGQMAYPVDHAWYLCRPCREWLVGQLEQTISKVQEQLSK